MSPARILLIGYAGDPTVRHVIPFLAEAGFDFLELLEFYSLGQVELDLDAGLLLVHDRAQAFDLNSYAAIYQRLLYPGRPEPDQRPTRREQALFRALDLALGACNGMVVNPPYAGWENNLKPLQTSLLEEAGFLVPASLSTSIEGDFRAFAATGARIYKSNSGERSIVERIGPSSLDRAALLGRAPVLFQEEILGKDVRVHSVGGEVFAVEIVSGAVDYRYARRQGLENVMRPLADIPETVRSACIRYARSRGIFIGGFDFKVTDDDRWYCLEMNPCPGFESYDRILGGAIARSLRDALASA